MMHGRKSKPYLDRCLSWLLTTLLLKSAVDTSMRDNHIGDPTFLDMMDFKVKYDPHNVFYHPQSVPLPSWRKDQDTTKRDNILPLVLTMLLSLHKCSQNIICLPPSQYHCARHAGLVIEFFRGGRLLRTFFLNLERYTTATSLHNQIWKKPPNPHRNGLMKHWKWIHKINNNNNNNNKTKTKYLFKSLEVDDEEPFLKV